MEKYLLVEGVNIYANVLDTNQLSVIRGSSFLLKDGIAAIETELQGHLKPLSVGASSGLFKVQDGVDLESVRDRVRMILSSRHKDCPFATQTFIIETCEAKDLLQAKEQLLGQLRVRQLRSATLAVDDTPPGGSTAVSEWHGVRPAGGPEDKVSYNPPGESRKEIRISHSEKCRWDYGRDKERERGQSYHLEEVERLCQENGKYAIDDRGAYEALKKQLAKWHFCRELGHIADSTRPAPDSGTNSAPAENYPRPLYPKLHGKIAVFYADGNSFTKIQRKIIDRSDDEEKEQAQIDFDRTIRGNRAKLLAALLEDMLEGDLPDMKTWSLHNVHEGEKSQDVPALRFETLLWGGDELMFVLPAWAGFEFAQRFFRYTCGWKTGGYELSHSAGLVFCSAKTPIRIARDLAQMIADDIKQRTDRNGGKRNAWDYMVLESIDYPTHRDYRRFLRERYGDIRNYRPQCLPGEAGICWKTRSDDLKAALRDNLPVRQLYRLGQAITREAPEILFHPEGSEQPGEWPVKSPKTLLEKLENRLLELAQNPGELRDACRDLAALLGVSLDDDRQRAWLWLHLLELREYIAPRREEVA